MASSHCYESDYRRILSVIGRRKVDYIPMYEHNISPKIIGEIVNEKIDDLLAGDYSDKVHYFKILCDFYNNHGYDCIPFACSILPLIQGGRGLIGQGQAIIKNENDLIAFPWDETVENYFQIYDETLTALQETLPKGMKAIGGVGYGLFESMQDFLPLTELAYLEIDEPIVFAKIWEYVGTLFIKIWTRLLHQYGDAFAVCRIGDDLGFKTSLLMKPETFHTYVKPQYVSIVKLIHSYGKPFLFHSCGCIWDLMESLIDEVHIDAKHSNEDEIAPFDNWVQKYGEQIALFGGVDVNILCLGSEKDIEKYVVDLLEKIAFKDTGIAIGSGNQIAEYVPPANFITMVETIRNWRKA